MPILALREWRCDCVEAHRALNRGQNRLHCRGKLLVVQWHWTAAQIRVASLIQVRVPEQQADVVNL
jgi:hypothetical protein